MSYPKLTSLFEIISGDNGGCTADEFEALLQDLTDDELYILGAGEETEQIAVKEKLVGVAISGGYEPGQAKRLVELLDEFLNRAFDA